MSQDNDSSIAMKSKTRETKPSAVDEDLNGMRRGLNTSAAPSGKQYLRKIVTKESNQSQKSKMKNSIIETQINETMEKVSAVYLKGSRKGDPRMNKAVEAKHADPALSLLDALLLGGFNFPGYDEKSKNGMNEQEIYDENGITMRQRKNQLGRRLRSLRDQEEEEKKEKSFRNNQTSTNQNDRGMNHLSFPLDLSRAQGELQSHFLHQDMIQMPASQFSSIDKQGLLHALVASSFHESQNATTNKDLPHNNALYPLISTSKSLKSPHSALPHSESMFSRGRYNQSVISQAASSSQVAPSLQLTELLLSYARETPAQNNSDTRNLMDSLSLSQNSFLTRKSSSIQQNSRRPASTIPSTTYNMNQQEEDLQQQLLLLLKNEYIHNLSRGQHTRRQVQQNHEEVQKILASRYPPTSNTIIANDLIHQKIRSAVDSSETFSRASFLTTPNEITNIDNNEKMATVIEDDSSSKKKCKKRRHSTSSQMKSKKHKRTNNSSDNEVTPNSSPRFENAMKTFHDKFDAFAHSCMEEAGYTRDECMELMKTFQEEVTRKTK